MIGMFSLANGCRRTAVTIPRFLTAHHLTVRCASRISIPTPPPFPVVERCPSPTCQCREIPEPLDIDTDSPLNNTTAAYAEQILVSTGHSGWKSRIEEDEDAVFVRQLKKYLGRGGKFSDPFHNVLITNSSFTPTSVDADELARDNAVATEDATPKASAYLLPSFRYVPSIPTSDTGVESFLKAFVLPPQLHSSHDVLSREQKNILLRQPEVARQFPSARPVSEILILVCGHMARDKRCGIMAPVLLAEFRDKLARQNVTVLADGESPPEPGTAGEYVPTVRLGSISHIGGHKFAGNVIVYIPPEFEGNALKGKGVWYGRVQPGNVEGIVGQTVLGGKVIKELFRGGVGQGGEVLRL